MDVRIAHPVPLAVQHVVADLHVLHDLRDREHRGAGHERGWVPGVEQGGAAADLQPALQADDAADVGGVRGAAAGEDVVADGVQLAAELGAYDDFKVGQLGYLQSLAFRACRLVVDTGIHTKRWTRDQGRAFFVERNGSKPEEVASEVDRYCSWPGQACGYKIGHTEIVRQRARAQAAMGAGYDLKTFDDAVITGGNVPLDVLGRNVDRYIAGVRN